ncbi:MAG: Extensin family protein [Polaromonas sp.]|nr:Extensin family protein [Polaromonas sp.]
MAPVLCSLIAAFIYAFVTGRLVVPERFNPWAPLNVMAPPDWLTGYKLAHARSDPARCLNALAQTGMAYDLLPDRITGPACGFENAVRLRNAGVRLGGPVALSCPVALSFFMWETHALQPAAQRHLQQRVTAIDHLGSYACRNVNRGEAAAPGNAAALAGSRSRHATANALDIAGFTLENGKRITILNHWRQNPQQETARSGSEALFLSSAHDGACRFFDGVLGPGYNAVHRDHFHLETGGYRMCR